MIAKHFAGKLLAARDTPMLEMKTQNIAIWIVIEVSNSNFKYLFYHKYQFNIS
jgi:hypothetical protein